MQEKKIKIPKRLILNIKEKLHEEIKKRAAFRGETITAWVITAIWERIQKEITYE